MPFLDKAGLAHLWNHIVARLNGKAEQEALDELEASLTERIDNIDFSPYETTTDAQSKLDEAKSYADSAATTAATAVKNDLLNGAGTAYDTLKELGDLIDENTDAIDALETVASGKADAEHTHDATEVFYTGPSLTSGNNELDSGSDLDTIINYLDDVISSKQNDIVGAASTITNSNLTINKALISDSSGKVAVSAVTSTELGYLDGVTSNIQTQLDEKSDSSHNHDSTYDALGSADTALESANTYTDNAIAQKTQVQIITWGADD